MQISKYLSLPLALLMVGLAQVGLAQSTPPPASLEEAIDQALAAEQNGDCAAAENLWQLIIQSFPDGSPELAPSYYNLGNVLYCQGDVEAAAEAYRRAIGLAGDRVERALAYKGLGDAFYATNQIDSAIEVYREAIQIDPNYATAYLALGNALYTQRQPDQLEEAAAAYRRATELNRGNVQAWVGLGNVLDDLGHLTEDSQTLATAIDAYQQAIALDPNYAQTYVELGIALSRQNRFEEAQEAYQQAIDINPAYPVAYVQLGQLFLASNQPEAAIQSFQQAIQLYPDYEAAYNGIIAAYSQLTQQYPNEAANYVSLGNWLSLQGNADAATAAYQQAIAVDPNHVQYTSDAYNGLGRLLLSQEQTDEAIESYQTAIEIDPTHTFAYVNLGIAWRERGRLNRALDAYEAALQLEDQYGYPTTAHVLAHNGIGLILKDQEDLTGAIAAFEQAVSLDPNYQSAQENLLTTQALLNPSHALEELPSAQEEPLIDLLRAVVIVEAETLIDGTGYGTGWVIKREGNKAWILTNRHVIWDAAVGRPCREVAIELYSRSSMRRRISAEVVNVSSDKDMALLEVTDLPNDIEPLELSLMPPQLETPIRVIGHPFSISERQFLYWTVSTGEVNNYQENQLSISITTGGGASGAPVIDRRSNQVIGLLWGATLLDRGSADFGAALPLSYIAAELEQWGVISTTSLNTTDRPLAVQSDR